jgi:hypothetical protein
MLSAEPALELLHCSCFDPAADAQDTIPTPVETSFMHLQLAFSVRPSCKAPATATSCISHLPSLCHFPCRNVTLTGLPGQQPLLDFDFNLSVLELCDNCTFTIEDVAIANDRRGANAQLDFFLGRGNSVLNLTNVIRKRVSCTSIEPALRLVHTTQRSPRFPARNGSKEQVGLQRQHSTRTAMHWNSRSMRQTAQQVWCVHTPA